MPNRIHQQSLSLCLKKWTIGTKLHWGYDALVDLPTSLVIISVIKISKLNEILFHRNLHYDSLSNLFFGRDEDYSCSWTLGLFSKNLRASLWQLNDVHNIISISPFSFFLFFLNKRFSSFSFPNYSNSLRTGVSWFYRGWGRKRHLHDMCNYQYSSSTLGCMEQISRKSSFPKKYRRGRKFDPDKRQ